MDRKTITRWESGLPETVCGRGSKFDQTEEIRYIIPRVIKNHDIKSVADVGCGDQNWIHSCLPDSVKYVGYDIQPRHQDVFPLDVSRTVLPTGYDLVLLIYVLNHMRPDAAERALKNIQKSGSRYLLMSYSDGDEYALPGNLISSVFHKDTGRHVWHYGLWKL
jgi:hypothetical protein